MTQTEYDGLKQSLAERAKFGAADSFFLAKACSRLLNHEESEQWGRDLAIRVLESFSKMHSSTRPIWMSIVEAAGLYPYLVDTDVSGSGALRREFHRSRALTDTYFHREQVAIANLLEDGKSVILSAPTSFGKSLLIQEIVKSGRYRNIVIIQPTLALLDETRKRLHMLETGYRLVVSTTQMPADDQNIFLFTGERVVEYKHFPTIDFFIIDEFYKLSLSRDDERAISLNQALYRLLKQTTQFYLLGPSVKSVSEDLAATTGATWVRSEYATVAVDVEPVTPKRRVTRLRLTPAKRRALEKEQELFELLESLKEPTLIYCSSPNKARNLATGFANKLNGNSVDRRQRQSLIREMVEWIDDNIHSKWALRDALRSGIAYHHGAIPRHLGSSIVDGFNDKSIHYLFCTSTLIEGVNTVARNVVLFDELKGKKPIDYFDYKNIVGRSGRMKVHYVGKVYQFAKRPAQIELEVDVPLFSQETAPLELLVQLDRDDLQPVGRKRVDAVFEDEPELGDLVKANSGIWVEGQVNLVNELRRDIHGYSRILSWNSIPTYAELSVALDLCYRFLMKPTDSKGGISAKQLAVFTLQYAGTRSLKAVIEQNLDSPFWRSRIEDQFERIQEVVHLVLNTSRQWFDYRLPKVLTALSSIQNYVFTRAGLKAGNFSYLAAQLENSFLKGTLSTLLDYDVPMSAIRKIESQFRGNESWSEIQARLKRLDFDRMGLLPYEKRKLAGLAR